MADAVRVGVVGTSWWADLMHLPGLSRHPHAELRALCGRSRDRAEALAAKYGVPHVFSDYRDLIARGDLEALVIATPDDLHYPIAMAALDAGLHVLCEKPLALTATQAREMYEKAEEEAVRHMVFFTNRWVPVYRYVRHLLDEGYVGRYYHLDIRYLGGYGRDGHYNWRFDSRRANGILGDLGSHMIDLARWYVGDIDRVSGQLSTFVDRPGPDGQPLDPADPAAAANDAALICAQSREGAQVTILVSAVAQVGDRGIDGRVVLHGEEGALEVEATFQGTQVRGARRGEDRFRNLPIPEEWWGEADQADRAQPYMDRLTELFAGQPVGARQFIDAIVGDHPAEPTFPTFYDGLQAQTVMDAAIEAHRSGCWVEVA
jgi:predicted dehydrogenase